MRESTTNLRKGWIAPTFSALLLAAGLGACSSSNEGSAAAKPACTDTPISSFKELVVVDEAVIDDARAKNANDGVWSFRYAMENIAPPGADMSQFIQTWLVDWTTTRTLNGYALDRPNEFRDEDMNKRILCPWLHRTPENACDDTCSQCTGHVLDMAKAPFRLNAIVNRTDLRDEVADEPFGEGRLVFSATDGVGDDPASKDFPLSVIFEYRLPTTRSMADWAKVWHSLGQHQAFDESFRAELETLTSSFVKRGANPAAANGSALAQIRSNESLFNWIWQVREFAPDATGQLRMRPLRNTPAAQLNESPILRDFITQNADAIQKNRFEMPEAMRAGSADEVQFSWSIPGVDEPLRKAFASNTCNGCHAVENPSIDTVFHISPFRRGQARISPYLNDQLAHRSLRLSQGLCGL